jgi:hypothetical protein
VRRAESGVIAISSSAGAEVQLKANADIKGPLRLANIHGGLEFASSSDTQCVCVPREGSALTPLYRMLHYEDLGLWRTLLGDEPKVGQDFVSPARGISLFPADEETLGVRAALHA